MSNSKWVGLMSDVSMSNSRWVPVDVFYCRHDEPLTGHGAYDEENLPATDHCLLFYLNVKIPNLDVNYF